jgi:hypothetical protein
MSDHPSIDALRAHLDAPDPALGAHLDACGECTRRAARLSGGLAALDEARRLTPVPPAWERMDDVLAREAQSVSQNIRSGRLRPATRVPSWVATGLAMAAGVGLLLGGRALLKSQETPSVAPIASRPTPTVAPAPVLTPYEGVVLLAAGGARYREPGVETGALLARTTGLREGASVETPDAARAVFTVRSGWTADLRPGSSMKLSQLRTEQTAVTLDRGELALTPGAGQTLPARVLHDGWSVETHGPLLARVEPSVLRVVVLAGRTDIRRGEAEAFTVTGPLVMDLPLDGSAPIRSTLTAADQAALDLDALSALGTSFEIPSIDPTATLTLLHHGALPSALESIRLAGPGTIQARFGRTEMRLELGAGVTPRWATFRSTVAPTVALNRVNSVARAAPPAAETGDTMPPDRAMLAVTNSARRIFGTCIDTCVARGRCQQPITGRVDVEMSAEGQASIVSTHASMAPVRDCFERQRQFVHGPRWQNSYRFAVPFDRR